MAAARWLEFAAAALLFGAPLFFLNGIDEVEVRRVWPRWLSPACAIAIIGGAILALGLQTAAMTGEAAKATDLKSLEEVLMGTTFGHGTGARILLAALAYVAALTAAGRGAWLLTALAGSGVLASFAWTGHGAADEGVKGLLHLSADVFHLLAAGAWIGALAGLMALLFRGGSNQAVRIGLTRFSGVATLIVAVLLASGIVSVWLLIGPEHIVSGLATDYGRLLIAKVALFVLMLGLAGMNRLVLTPRLAEESASGALKWSIGIETAAALAVLAVVAVMGTLPPPMAG